jgi:hypothetical protein
LGYVYLTIFSISVNCRDITLDQFSYIESYTPTYMDSRKKIHVKVMANLTDAELNKLVDGLKKIEGFRFSIDSFLWVTPAQVLDAV